MRKISKESESKSGVMVWERVTLDTIKAGK